MKLAVEITLYPLCDDYIPVIQDFIERLNKDDRLSVKTSDTCTLVSGDYDHLMATLSTEFKQTYQQVGQAAFVCKFLNATNMQLSA